MTVTPYLKKTCYTPPLRLVFLPEAQILNQLQKFWKNYSKSVWPQQTVTEDGPKGSTLFLFSIEKQSYGISFQM